MIDPASMMQISSVDVKLPQKFFHFKKNSKKYALLLHGYSDTGLSLARRIFSQNWPDYEILAPNSVFPAPMWHEGESKEAYSWFFRDSRSGRFIIPPEFSISHLSQLLQQLDLDNKPCVLVGFSQGGYLAPLVASSLSNVKAMVLLNTGFRKEFYDNLEKIPVTAIHGTEDEIIPCTRAEEEFLQIEAKASRADFIKIPGMKHAFNAEGAQKIQVVLADFLGK